MPELNRPESLEEVLLEAFDWAARTFPAMTTSSCLHHLQQEVEELALAPDDPEEMADVAMLLGHLAHHQGINLAAACRVKLEKNKQRAWGKPDEHGVVRHLEEER
jgi:hypothetical protein